MCESVRPAPEEPRLLAAEPQLYVADLERALAYYRDKLGFAVVFAHGEPAFYAQVARGGARLNLRLTPLQVFTAEFRAREPDPVAAVMTVENIAGLFEACRAAGAELHQPLRREPWGAQTFIVRDPDGNLLAFAGN